MSPVRLLRTLSADVLVAAALTLATLAAVSAEVPSGPASPVFTVGGDGLPGKGLPPSPGPTDPNGPNY